MRVWCCCISVSGREACRDVLDDVLCAFAALSFLEFLIGGPLACGEQLLQVNSW